MKQIKKEHYEDVVYPGIHTVSGTIPGEVSFCGNASNYGVKACSHRKIRNKEEVETYVQLNPNDIVGKRTIIRKYSEFMSSLKMILMGAGKNVEDLTIKRADLSFNSDDPGDYELYQKLHKLLICGMADAYSFENCYQSCDLWTHKSLNVAIKNDDYEMENYNKAEENPDHQVKNRLELRSKRIKDSDVKKEFLEVWFKKLDKAVTRFDDVQKRYNEELEKLYKEDLEKPKKQRKYFNLNAFLLQHQDCIFSTKQMVDLLGRFDEVKNAESKARTFKKNHRIEYFSKSDLEFVVDVLKRKTREYFAAAENVDW